MDLTEKLLNVRRATRLLAAYYRRVQDILGMVEQTLEQKPEFRLRFLAWDATRHKNIGKQTTNPIGRWGWDFLPYWDAHFRWTTAGKKCPTGAGSAQVYFQQVTDDGYESTDDRTEPDPNDFKPASETETWIYVYLYVLARGECSDSWESIDSVFEDTAESEDHWSGEVVRVNVEPLDDIAPGSLIQYVGWRIRVAELETEDDVENRLLAPLRGALDRALVPPTQ